MPSAHTLNVVVVVGLRTQEFLRLRAKIARFRWPVDLVNGGHISEGSNASRDAQIEVSRADLVLWNPQGARHFSAGIIPLLRVRRIHGVSGAFRAIVDELAVRQDRARCVITDTALTR